MNNCGCCCTNTLNYCDQDLCAGVIDFDIKALSDGTHTMVTNFLGKDIIIKKDFLSGDEIIFPIDMLNEDFQYTVELFDPLGEKIVIRKNLIEYDCFRFKTVLTSVIIV